jgi:hypothetical protein
MDGWGDVTTAGKIHSPWKACIAPSCQSWLGVPSRDLAAFLVLAPAAACQCLPAGLLSGGVEEAFMRLWVGFRRELKWRLKPRQDIPTGLRMEDLEPVIV